MLSTLSCFVCGDFLQCNAPWRGTFSLYLIKVCLYAKYVFIFPFIGPVISMLLSCFSHYEFWHISINMFVLWSFMPAFESTHPLVLAKSCSLLFQRLLVATMQCHFSYQQVKMKAKIQLFSLCTCRCVFILNEPL